MKNLNHLAVIMDGNSRWASNRNLPSKIKNIYADIV